MGLYEKIKDLANAIIMTQEFANLKQGKSLIDKNRDLRMKIEDFKKAEKLLLERKVADKEAQAQAEELKKTYEALSRIPEISNYIKVEREFSNMMMKVIKSLNESIETSFKS
jgi:cell fate (sporulation/competence/biofilm development) regulator YlbF (YheA/YmcA/DUF963 family)